MANNLFVYNFRGLSYVTDNYENVFVLFWFSKIFICFFPNRIVFPIYRLIYTLFGNNIRHLH